MQLLWPALCCCWLSAGSEGGVNAAQALSQLLLCASLPRTGHPYRTGLHLCLAALQALALLLLCTALLLSTSRLRRQEQRLRAAFARRVQARHADKHRAPRASYSMARLMTAGRTNSSRSA